MAEKPKRQRRSQPAWTDVKAKLASFDRRGLLGLIQDLYAAHKDNQTFLHTRFGLDANAPPDSALMSGMFGQALAVIGELPASDGEGFLAQLDDVCDTSHNVGYGAGESTDALLAMNPSA